MSRYMTIKEFAEFMRVSPDWIYTQIRKHDIRTRRIAGKLRFTEADAEQYCIYEGGGKKHKRTTTRDYELLV